jgi:hypothetical protein
MPDTSTDEAVEPEKLAVAKVPKPRKPFRPDTYLPVPDEPIDLIVTDGDFTKCRICFIHFEDDEKKDAIMEHMKNHCDKVTKHFSDSVEVA